MPPMTATGMKIATMTSVVAMTGAVTSFSEDEGFFEAPAGVGVGSVVEGVIDYATTPDDIYDPEPGDCALGYVFREGTMTITIAGYTAHGAWQAADSDKVRFRAVAPLGPAEGDG